MQYNIAIKKQSDGYMVENEGIYFKIGEQEGRVLERLARQDRIEDIATDEKVSIKDIEQLIEECKKIGLLGKQKTKNNILFYRIPLFEADKLFEKIVSAMWRNRLLVQLLLLLSLGTIGVGTILLGKNIRAIASHNMLAMNVKEYVFLYLAFLLTVCFHEFAHGTVCKYFGGKIGTLGFMLILFSPAMYCDISGIRMVEDKKKQILASFAGIYANILFTAIATIIYVIYPTSVVAGYIWLNITTIISNLIPFVRLDGYWILSFATGITNLYKKSLASVNKIFTKCGAQEKFMAIYGGITYVFMFAALISAGLSGIKAIQSVIQMFV